MILLVPTLLSSVAHASAAHGRCVTPLMLQLRDVPADSARLQLRPAEAGFVDSARFPIRVHYRRAQDAQRATLVVLPAIERAWEAQVVRMGWPQPPPDNGAGGTNAYDVYLTNQGTYGGAYTWGFGPDVTAGDDWYSVPSYIAVDDDPYWIDDVDMPTFLAHEFNHAEQYTIDAHEQTLFAWESTAEAMADLVDDWTDYSYELPSFQKLPWASLLFDSYSPELTATPALTYASFYYEYGGMLFATFLEERYGTKDGTTLLRLWDLLAQPSRVDEPDFLDALGQLDPSAPTFADVYTEFAVWRMFAGPDDDGAHYEEGGSWARSAVVAPADQLTLATVDGAVETPQQALPYDLGAKYYAIDLQGGTTRWLHVDVTDDPGARWALVWAVWPAAGPARTGSTLVDPGQPLSADLDLSGGVKAEVGVVNAGDPALDPSNGPVARRSFTATFALEDPPAAATGDTGQPAP